MKYVIGDIHGEYSKLKQLIEEILPDHRTTLIFLGDYIGKGFNSKEVIDYLIQLNKKVNCVFLRGNHELMLLKAFGGDEKAIAFMERYGDLETVNSYFKERKTNITKNDIIRLLSIISKEHLSFFQNTRSYYSDDNYLIVHAGINPEKIVLDNSCEDIFFIRNKFIDCQEKVIDKRIIFGHTAFKNPYFDIFKVGIDTGAPYKDYDHLTAYNLDKGYCINHLGQIYYDPYFSVLEDKRN